MRIACTLGGKSGALDVVKDGENRLATLLEGIDGAPRTINVPGHSYAEIVGRQLSDRERDPIFRESMVVAQILAQSLLH